MVLKTIIRSLEQLGHDVHIAYFDKANGDGVDGDDGAYRPLPLPGVLQLLRNALRFAVDQRYTINEALYFSPLGRERCAKTIAAIAPELIVVDMLRCAQFVKAESVPVILDLDDLLSRRYAQLVGGSVTPEMMLGYYAERIPFLPLVGKLARPFLTALMSLESSRLKHKEIDAATHFDAVTLVSQREADLLRDQCDGPVTISSIPMAIEMSEQHASISEEPSRLIFVGSPSYWPNRQALAYADEVLFPYAESRLGTPLALTVVGAADESHRAGFNERLHFTGYVDDLDAVLTEHDIFVAPIVSGSGIKTKVVEAMSRGLVVLGSPKAFDGLSVEHLEHALIFETKEEFAEGLAFLKTHPEEARRIAESGFRYISDTFRFDVITERWRKAVESVFPPAPSSAPEAKSA
jgi:glycosyltransferase involved in cell wall biosynthesis